MRLSYSGIDTYKTCGLKYKFREIDKLPEPKSKEAVFGTLIHSTMKFIHDPALLSPTLEQALDHFSKNWNSDIWTEEIEERTAFSQGVGMIQRYYQDNRPSDARVIALESRFGIEIDGGAKNKPALPADKHVLSGVIDRIDKTDDGYEIIDYKTARKMPSQDKVDHDLQLTIYLRAFLERYPAEKKNIDKITVSLYYLKHGVKLSSHRTETDLTLLDQTVLDVVKSIEEKKFDPILSPLCDWCGFQPVCPLWKHKFKTEEKKLEKNEGEQAVEEFLALRAKTSEDKKRMAELQAIIMRYMDQEGLERLFGTTGIIGKSVRTSYSYDEAKLRELLIPLGEWENVVKIDGVALKTVLAALPTEVRKQAEEYREKKESISLSVKALKGLPEEETE